MAYLLAIASAAVYGGADFLGGLATRRSSIFPVIFVSHLVGLALLLSALPLLPSARPLPADLTWGAAAGLAGAVGIAWLYQGLAAGVMSVVAPVTAVLAVAIPVAFALAWGERPPPSALSGIGLAAVGVTLVALGEGKEVRVGFARGLRLGLAAGVPIGLFLVCLGRTGSGAGLWPLVPARVVSITLFALLALALRRPLRPAPGAWALVISAGAFDMVANVLYLLAVRRGPLSLVATLTNLYPVSTLLLASVVLGERARRVQVVGIACAVAAIVLMTAA
jgi:drug/metabolite transporter (DMT)-like permease